LPRKKPDAPRVKEFRESTARTVHVQEYGILESATWTPPPAKSWMADSEQPSG
jgi:hypothetical protein